ncbi:MAG: hypothetical protein IT580_01880 [Verrucomicrobiales bacterium]|nr:hypothetical protein [Verrucomicrobiales bacterium]
MRTRRSWSDKLLSSKPPEVKRLAHAFADMPEGCQMLIASPQLVDEYLRRIPAGTTRTTKTLRDDLAAALHAEHTCPLTTGIFLRIAAEAAWEQHQAGSPLAKVAPFWRAIDPDSTLAKKITCGPEFIRRQRAKEAQSKLPASSA